MKNNKVKLKMIILDKIQNLILYKKETCKNNNFNLK